MANCALIFSLILFCVGVALSVSATLVVGWARILVDLSFGDLYFGLYNFCVQQRSDEFRCSEYHETKSYLKATRGLDHTAVALAVVATLLCFLHAYKISHNTLSKPLGYFIVTCGILSVILHVATLGVYGSNYKDEVPDNDDFKLHVSFVLEAIAAIVLLVASIVAIRTNREQTATTAGRVLQPQQGGGVTIATGQPAMMPMAGYPSTAIGQQYPPTYNNYHQPGTMQPAPQTAIPSAGYSNQSYNYSSSGGMGKKPL